MPETVLDPMLRIMDPNVDSSPLDKSVDQSRSSDDLAYSRPNDPLEISQQEELNISGFSDSVNGAEVAAENLLVSNSNGFGPDSFMDKATGGHNSAQESSSSCNGGSNCDSGTNIVIKSSSGDCELATQSISAFSTAEENIPDCDQNCWDTTAVGILTDCDSLSQCKNELINPNATASVVNISTESESETQTVVAVANCSPPISSPFLHRPSPEPEKRSLRPRSSHFRADSPPGLHLSTPRSRISSVPCSGQHGQRTLNSSPVPSYRTMGAAAESPVPPLTGPGDGAPLSLPLLQTGSKSYDYLLKVLLVGDSDVGKQEIITGMEDGSLDSPYCSSTGAAYKTTIILIDGKKVKLHIWDTSGQGRFCTIIRSYSRGAQGILLVYDITNRWSFEGIERWVREVEEHAPGIPKVLVGNRLHLAFKRQVDPLEAEAYAEKNNMGFYEISPLVNFNITESFQELCRMALKRNGMERLWRSNKVLTLHEICCHAIVARTASVYSIDRLPLPEAIKANLKSYAMTSHPVSRTGGAYRTLKERKKKGAAAGSAAARPPDASSTKCVNVSRKSCVIM